MKRSIKPSILIIILLFVFVANFSLSCDAGDNRENDEDDDAAKDDVNDDEDNNDDNNDDDNNAVDDESYDDDDDYNDIDITATVTMEPVPEENPLARKIIVKTDMPCSLSGKVTTLQENGYGPSDPLVSQTGTVHEFWFYGLLESRQFKYRFYLEGAKSQVIAEGFFSTPALPSGKPVQVSLDYAVNTGFSDWYMVYQSTDLMRIFIYDRTGRVRFYHESGIGQFNQVLDNGDIVGTNNSELRALRLDGTEYTLFNVNLNSPVHRNTHHKFYLPFSDSDWAMVVFARKGPGYECDLTTPTDQAVGDGIAQIDEFGNEVWRFDVFDHLDEIPPEAIDPDMCLYEFWGPDTIDFTHGNSVVPVPGENAYLISYRNVSRVLKISRDTGDIIWQMGRNLDFTWIGDEPWEEHFFRLQHDPHILPNGNLLLYDNNKGQSWSRVLELKMNENGMTVEKVWEYRTPYNLYEGNVQQHDNGNRLIATGNSTNPMVIELLPHGVEGEEIFKMAFTTGNVRAEYYPAIWISDGNAVDGDKDDEDFQKNEDDGNGEDKAAADLKAGTCGSS